MSSVGRLQFWYFQHCQRPTLFTLVLTHNQRINTVDKFDELVTQRTTLLDQAQALVDAGVTAGFLTEEDDKKITDLHSQAEALTAKINELQAANDRAAKALETQNKLKATRLNPVVNRIKMIGTNSPAMPSNGDIGGFKLPANVRRFNPTNFAPEADESGRQPVERAYRFGQWALATATMCMPGKFHFYNAVEFCQNNGLLNVHGEGGSDVSGAGVFVPDEFSTDIIRLVEKYGVIRQLVPATFMRSETKTTPRRVGGLTAYAVGENQAGTESDAEWNEVKLVAKKWMVLTRMSNELSEDSVVSIANELIREIALAFAIKEDQSGFLGTGTSTYNGIVGIVTKLDTLTAGTAPGLILGAGNAYSELTLANFSSVVAALPEYAAAMPKWVSSRSFFYNVMQPLALAAGGTTAGDIVNGIEARFLGYPVVFAQVMPSTAANSQIPVLFGDYAMGCQFGDRRLMNVEFSDQATVGGQSVWERDQIAIKATSRNDFVCHDFGTASAAGPIVGLELAGS
jgi:HK97 family phage major capsid protein